MNILLVADLHYTLQQYDWLQQVAAEFDAVVIAGDLLEVASPVPREGQMIAVLKHLEAPEAVLEAPGSVSEGKVDEKSKV